MNRKSYLSSKNASSDDDQESRRRRAHESNHPRNISGRRRSRNEYSRTPLDPVVLSSLMPLGSRCRAQRSTNTDTTFPRDIHISPPTQTGLRRLVRHADVERPTRSTHVAYKKFIGNGRLSEWEEQRIRLQDFDGYEALADYLYELSGGIIASVRDAGASPSRRVSLHIATVYYTRFQDSSETPMTPMLRTSNWELFQMSAYRMEIRWLPFRPHLARFLDFARQF